MYRLIAMLRPNSKQYIVIKMELSNNKLFKSENKGEKNRYIPTLINGLEE